MMDEKREFTRRGERITELVSRIENSGDLATRALAKELLQAVLELHAAALERVLDTLDDLPGAAGALDRMAQDEIVSGVLSLHGLHPVALEERVAAAVESVRPYLQARGGDVELGSIEGRVVHVRLQGSCGSRSDSSQTLQEAVESAIFGGAPEIAAVVSEATPARTHPDLFVLPTP